MEDKKLPWWRRALHVALEGIRSGFGLFPKAHKDEPVREPGTVAKEEYLSKESAVADTSAAEAVAEAQSAEGVIARSEMDPVAETAARVAEPTAEADSDPVAETQEVPVEETTPEVEDLQGSPLETVPEQVAVSQDEALTNVADENDADAKREGPESSIDIQPKVAWIAGTEQVGSEESRVVEDIAELVEHPTAAEEVQAGARKIEDSDNEGPHTADESEGTAETPRWALDEENQISAEERPESAETSARIESEDEPANSVSSFSEALEAAFSAPPEMAVEEGPLAASLEAEHNLPEPESAPAPEEEAKTEASAFDEAEIEAIPVEDDASRNEPEVAAALEPPEEIAKALEEPANAQPTMTDTEEQPIPISQDTEEDAETVIEANVKQEGMNDPVVFEKQEPEDVETAIEVVDAVSEPVIVEESEIPPAVEVEATATETSEVAPTQESILEEPVSSIELREPDPEEIAEAAPELPDKSEIGLPPDAAAVSETALPDEQAAEPATEQEIEQVAEEIPEPVDTRMELDEPIPEQPTTPTEAAELTAATEEVAGSVPSEATAEQPIASGDQIASEASAEAADEAGPTVTAPAAPSKPFIKLESRDNENDLSPFSVVVSQVYDGPLDLLLDLIRKQDIDVYDIPIARITAQFLAYVNQLKATDVDVAGEFIYTASLLIHIKSKMLLPRAPSGGDDAAEDPRRELVERLLEHERFKNAAQMLQQKQMLEAATWSNPGMREFQDDTSAEPEIAADTVDLVRIFRDILERARNRPVINVQEDSVTVGQMIQFLSRRLTMEDKPVALRRLLSQTRSERALIAMFLALLELVRLQAILLRQDRLFSEIFIKKHVGFESVMNEGAASVHDDWR